MGTKLYWYGSGGEILAETDAAGNTLNAYVFFGGKRVALVPATGTPLYYAEDMLGSSRVIVQSNGTLCYDADFTPFGAEKTATSTCAQNYKFEGKERDSESGNDDFGARYYSWRFGRWLSADWSSVPVAVPYANLTNPQTLNLYAMVADDPESFADLVGHYIMAPSDAPETPLTQLNKQVEAKDSSPQPSDSSSNSAQAQNQQQSNSSNDPNYKKGVPPATGDLKKVLQCTQSCVGKQLTVTSTNEPLPNGKHGPDTPHGKGEAADLRVNKGGEGKVLQCAANCGAKFGLDERAHPSGPGVLPHVHIQTVPGTHGGRGDLPEPED